jgi:hypothetical protein
MALPFAPRRPDLLGPALLLLLWLGLRLPAAPAQTADGVYYTNTQLLSIPFTLDQGDRRIQQLQLHVSDDLGRTYQNVGNAGPGDKAFTFPAPRDGWYWFILQTKDHEGRLIPANLSTAQPGLKVCVDTRKPDLVVFKPVLPAYGTVAVEWEVRDDNLDLLTLRLDYRPVGGRDWTVLNVEKLARAQFGWVPTVNGPCEVRLRVGDKANNFSEATVTVTPQAAAAPSPGAATTGRSTFGPADGKRAHVRHVRSKQITLNYKIGNVGPSAVQKVEVWQTRDTTVWTRLTDNAPATGPYVVNVPGQGRYGFTLVPVSGVGLARERPRAGEQPRLWVEVDETPPEVRLYRVDVGRDADAGKMTIHWTASDPHLRANPITIAYALARDAPEREWRPLPGAENIANRGSLQVATEGLPFEFYLKVTAVDEAGNPGSALYPTSIKVDLKVPQVEDLDVHVAEPPPPAPAPKR